MTPSTRWGDLVLAELAALAAAATLKALGTSVLQQCSGDRGPR